jgi:hypothetical protein
MPRSKCTLFTWQAAAVAWLDWVEALQHRRDKPLGLADDARGLAHLRGRDVADLGDPLRRVRIDRLTEGVEPDRARLDVLLVDPAVLEQLALEPVHQRDVGAVPGRQVHVGLLGDRRPAGIDADQPRRVGAAQPVEHSHPQNRLHLGDVVPVDGERVAVVHVCVRPGLTVGAERRLERRGCGRGAETGVAVHVRRAEACLSDHGERVVLLEEELARRIEAEAAPAAGALEQLLRAVHDPAHGGVPVRLDERPMLAHERAREPVRRVVGLPAVQVLGIQTPMVDSVDRATAHADDPVVLHGNVDGVAVRVEHRRDLGPTVDVAFCESVLEMHVDPHRPGLAGGEWRALSPGIGDAILGHVRRPPHASPVVSGASGRPRGSAGPCPSWSGRRYRAVPPPGAAR